MDVNNQEYFDYYDDGVDGLSENEKARRRMNEKRAAERDITIPACCKPHLKENLKDDPEAFLRYCFPGIFYNPFTDDQLVIINAIWSQIRYGGYRAIAAARGDGKTSITIGMIIWAVSYGHVKFPVLVAANATKAAQLMDNIKYQIEFNNTLTELFPEVCAPVRALEGANQRANGQTVNGKRTNLQWNGEEVHFPEVEGSAASGSIMLGYGLDGAIRGALINGLRPDFVLIDDPQTRASAASAKQTQDRRQTILEDVLGLAGPGAKITVTMLCTILRCGDLADEFTDRQLQPAFKGIKQRLLITEPEENSEADMCWKKYMELRRRGMVAGDEHAREGHCYYLANRSVMDGAVEVNNPYRVIDSEIEQTDDVRAMYAATLAEVARTGADEAYFWMLEVSAKQHTYNKICDMGRAAFDAEYQNNPSAASSERSEITATTVMRKLSHLECGQVPAWAAMVVRGVDVGGRMLYWIDVAVGEGYRSTVINYGCEPVDSPAGDLREADPDRQRQMQAAIYEALIRLDEQAATAEYTCEATGELFTPVMATVDSGSGLHTDAVYAAVKAYKRYRAIKGCGQGQQNRYKAPGGGGIVRGRFYWASYQKSPHNLWLHHLDSDTLKNFVHQGFLTPEGKPGSISLYGSEAVVHQDFARHITAEIWCRTFIDGKGWVEKFDVIHGDNHWLDALAYAIAAAEIAQRGRKLAIASSGQLTVVPRQVTADRPQVAQQRLTAEDIAKIRQRRVM